MKLYEVAVRKPISTILIFVAVIVLGLFSLRNLAIDQYPDMEIPYIMVITSYTGANASDIETNITRVLEDNLNTVNKLKTLSSTSQDNVSMITLEFEWGADLNEAANDVRDVTGRMGSYLPDEADTPMIMKFSTSMMPVAVLVATAEREETYRSLYKTLDDKLVNTLNRVDGVGSVTMMGEPIREIQVNVDPNKLDAYKLTVEQLGQIIAAENVNVPSGTIDIGNNTFTVKSDGEFDDSDLIKKIVVTNQGGRAIFLEDVAEVKDTLAKQTMDVRLNGERGVVVMIQKQSGANTVSIVQEVFGMLPQIESTLPDDVKLETVYDGSESIQDSINSLSETVMFAFLFVILVVLFFLGRWRATLIICLTIPISLITSFIYLYITGSTLNIISLSSLSIAIGMVVDDAIVVLENITKHIERGSTPKEAAIYGTNEVWLAVIATTLVIVAVFMPLTMLSGMAGIMFKELGWIVSIVVVVSTIAAVTLTPMLTSLMLRPERVHTYKGLGIIFKPIDRFLDKLDNGYAKVLTWVVRHRAFTLTLTFAIFVASVIFIMPRIPSDFMPASDTAVIQAEVQLEQNIGVDYTTRIARQIDSIIYREYPEVYLLNTRAGASNSNNAMAMTSTSGSYIITYMMRLHKLSERESGRTIFEISDLFREELDKIPEIREFTVTPGGSTGAVGGNSVINIKIFGQDLDQTDEIARDIRDKVRPLESAGDVQLSRDDMRPEYNVVFDRERLALYGLNSATASTAIRNRINGLEATKYREDGDEYDVVVRYGEEFRTSFDDIENITIYNAMGNGVKIRDIATIEEIFSPPAIGRENRQRMVSVDVTLPNSVAVGTAIQELNDKVLSTYELPEGVVIELGGTYEDMQESFSDIYILLILIILLVYIVMATQFESFKMPFIIMFTLPFALTGVLVALWMTGTSLSLIALIGAIMLVGIVVKNGIVMVDYTNLLRERGSSINQAVIASGKSRLRPVLMTSLTTILGMVPMAIGFGEGSEMWQPMGIAIIGGLTFSTALTLLVIPTVYAIFGAMGLKKEKREVETQIEETRRARRKKLAENKNEEVKK